ncbi:hypothetical protein EBU71_04250 [bacterium]|nr:hypothetical protein [Candidatus Elulimicrobium humile]
MEKIESKAINNNMLKFLKKFQLLIKQVPEWGILLNAWVNLSIIPLLVFTNAWKSLGTLALAFKVCAPLFLALGVINGLILFLYYLEDEID